MSSFADDRLERLREDLADAEKLVGRLSRLLQRQTRRRDRLNKTIAHTRRRLDRAMTSASEHRRALTASEHRRALTAAES